MFDVYVFLGFAQFRAIGNYWRIYSVPELSFFKGFPGFVLVLPQGPFGTGSPKSFQKSKCLYLMSNWSNFLLFWQFFVGFLYIYFFTFPNDHTVWRPEPNKNGSTSRSCASKPSSDVLHLYSKYHFGKSINISSNVAIIAGLNRFLRIHWITGWESWKGGDRK